MMDAAAGTLDLTMHGYVMVDMAGFSELIDAMGGVTVESGGWVPYRGQRPDGSGWGDTWLEPGVHTFDGDMALSFARSRDHSSDFNRIQRQQCIQQAMIAQFTPQTLLTRFTDIMTAGENLVETDIPQSQLGSLVDLAAEAQEHDPQRLTLGPRTSGPPATTSPPTRTSARSVPASMSSLLMRTRPMRRRRTTTPTPRSRPLRPRQNRTQRPSPGLTRAPRIPRKAPPRTRMTLPSPTTGLRSRLPPSRRNSPSPTVRR